MNPLFTRRNAFYGVLIVILVAVLNTMVGRLTNKTLDKVPYEFL